MAEPGVSGLIGWLQDVLTGWAAMVAQLLLSPGSLYSLYAIAACILIAALAILRGRSSGRRVPVRVLLRVLFPKRITRSRSGKADLFFAFFNIFLWGAAFGWAVFSAGEVARLTEHGLGGVLGHAPATQLPEWAGAVMMTAALFVAYEFGYWIHHYLSHKIPFLWDFHKVHHSAESLSPITVFRVHPVDTIVFYNVLAVTMGATQGLLGFALGGSAAVVAMGGTNVLLLLAGVLLVHLQHSHLWISFSGRLGRFLLSPAHHQIHHSANPIHHDRNFGSSLAVWDRLFGTLHVPARERERLTFGVADLGYDPHTLRGGFVTPVADTLQRLRPFLASRDRRLPTPQTGT